MSPITKAHSLAFAIATTCVYTIWHKLTAIQTDLWIINSVITFILSLSFYQVVFKIFLLLCQKVRLLRKYILGKFYFEGLWIGYYTINDEIEYYHEVVEQDLENISIIGVSYDKDRKSVV